MSNVKITELTAETNPVSTDVLPIVDVTADETKKVTIADLLKNAGSGDAAAPGVAFDGDSDTGMYRSGPNALGFATGGVGRFFIDNSGNITIGLNDQIELNSDGSARFPGNITIGLNDEIELNSDGSVRFSGNITIGLNDEIELNSDGSAQLSGNVGIAGDLQINGILPTSPKISLNAGGTTEYLAPIATGITASNVNTKVSHSFLYPAQNVTGGEGVVLALGMEARGRIYFAAEHTGASKDSIDLGIYAGHGTTLKKVADFSSGGGVEFYSYVLIGGYLCGEIHTSSTATLNLGSSNDRVRGPVINLTSKDAPEVVSGTDNESVVIDAGKSGSTNDAAIHLKTGTGSTGIDRLVVTGSGTVQIPGALTIGGTAAANTIDEYEVGTFTPAITSSTSPTQNYTTQTGDYVKIGDLVYVRVTVKFGTSITAGSGDLVCSLPFSAASYAGGTIMIAKSWVSDTPVMIQTQSGNASCALKRNLSNDGVAATNVQDNTEIHFSIVYQVQ